MQFEVFTLLPEVFPPYLESSILQRARQRGLIDVRVHNIRDYTHDRHHTTDDTPYGGGGGMVMKPEPVFEAVESVLGQGADPAQPRPVPVILLTPQGRVFTQRLAEELSRYERIALLCGRYEGVDERIREHLVSDEISVGDYVLTGGELPAPLVIDAVSRLLPGVLGDPTGAEDDSRIPWGCWSIRTIPSRPSSAAGRCPKCWSAATMPGSSNGGGNRRWRVPMHAARICSKRAELTDKDRKFIEDLKSKDFPS